MEQFLQILVDVRIYFTIWLLFFSFSAPAQIIVSNTNDEGAGSLRQAILDANTNPGPDTITFNILNGGPQIIRLDAALPTITETVHLDGSTQPGFAGSPLVQISYPEGEGLRLNGASNSEIQYLDFSVPAPCVFGGAVGVEVSNSSQVRIHHVSVENRGYGINILSGDANQVDNCMMSGSGCSSVGYALLIQQTTNFKAFANDYRNCQGGIRLEGINDMQICDTIPERGSSYIVIEPNSGLNQAEDINVALDLNVVEDIRVENVDLSATNFCNPNGGFGLLVTSAQRVVINNVNVSGRVRGISLDNSHDIQLINNHLNDVGCGDLGNVLTVQSVSQLRALGNSFENIRGGIYLKDLDNFLISNLVPDLGDHYLILEANSGISQANTSNTLLSLEEVRNAVIQQIDLSKAVNQSSEEDEGLSLVNCQSILIQEVDVSRRSSGIRIENSEDIAVKNCKMMEAGGSNNLPSLLVDNTRDFRASNNDFTNAQGGIRLQNLIGFLITDETPSVGQHYLVIDANSNLKHAENISFSLELNQVRNSIIENIDLSRSGDCIIGNGLGVGIIESEGIKLFNLNLANRGFGLQVDNSRAIEISNCNLSGTGCSDAGFSLSVDGTQFLNAYQNNFQGARTIQLANIHDLIISNHPPENSNHYLSLEPENGFGSIGGIALALENLKNAFIKNLSFNFQGEESNGIAVDILGGQNYRLEKLDIGKRTSGIRCTNVDGLQLTCTRFNQNSQGILFNNTQNAFLENNTFIQNTLAIINSASFEIKAENNYWGSSNGPGSLLIGVVDANPFLDTTPENCDLPDLPTGTITVSLVSDPADGTDFEFIANSLGSFILDFAQPDDEDAFSNEVNFSSLSPGQYPISINTLNLQGFVVEAIQINGDTDQESTTENESLVVDLDADENVVIQFRLQKNTRIPSPQFTISRFILVNPENNQEVTPLNNNDVISIQDYETSQGTRAFTIVAETTLPGTGNIEFRLKGPITQTLNDFNPPYALFGDIPVGNFDGRDWLPGSYTLTATPVSQGVAGMPQSIQFQVTNQVTDPVNVITLANGNGNINPAGNLVLSNGEQITLRATPDPGFVFKNFTSENGAIVSLDNPFVLTAESDTMIKANFIESTTDDIVNGFTLIDAEQDLLIRTLSNGSEINISELGNIKLDIRVFTLPASVGSVKMELEGPIRIRRLENFSPYALFGNSGDDFYGRQLAVGDYTLTATPYTGIQGRGVAGNPLTLQFRVTSDTVSLITEASEGGTVSPAGTNLFNISETISLLATPAEGYTFVNFTRADGSVLSTENPYDFVIQEKMFVRANFRPIAIESFSLIDPLNGNPVLEIQDNDLINPTQLGLDILSIQANAAPGRVASVVLRLDGPLQHTQVENFAPYALFANVGDNFNGRDLPAGTYTLEATPFSKKGGNGVAGQALKITFTILNPGGAGIPTADPRDNINLSAYPNPSATGVVNLDIKIDTRQTTWLKIWDHQGLLVREMNITGKSYQLLDLSELEGGAYIIRVIQDKKMIQKRVVLRAFGLN